MNSISFFKALLLKEAVEIPSWLKGKLEDVHTKPGQGSIFAKSIDDILKMIYSIVEIKARKGWGKINISEELPEIYKEYDMSVISEVYGMLRENGYRVNVMTHVVIWG